MKRGKMTIAIVGAGTPGEFYRDFYRDFFSRKRELSYFTTLDFAKAEQQIASKLTPWSPIYLTERLKIFRELVTAANELKAKYPEVTITICQDEVAVLGVPFGVGAGSSPAVSLEKETGCDKV